MSRSNSVLNFREIIINGIQDLESGVKRRSLGRENSFEKRQSAHSIQVEPPLPYFPGNVSQFERNQNRGETSHSTSNFSYIDNTSRFEESQVDPEKIQLQQFKKPSFTNPVQLSQIRNNNNNLGLKLNLHKQTPHLSSQKENFDSGGECTFRENKNVNYFKGINIQPSIKVLQSSNKKSGEDGGRQTENQQDNSFENNHERFSQLRHEQSHQSYSPVYSRMDQEDIFTLNNRPSNKIELNNDSSQKIINSSRKNDYFCIHDDPNQDKEQIIKTLQLNKHEVLNTISNSRNLSTNIQKVKIQEQFQKSDQNLRKETLNKSSSQILKRQDSTFRNQSSLSESKKILNRSSSTKKGIDLSPMKKSVSLKKNTLERFPSQVSYTDSLRSYSPTNKMLQSQPYNYNINKENLKKMILFFESDKIRGLYNLTAFIKFFRELGLMQLKNNDKFILQKEIQFVEELWRLLKFSSYSAECVSTSFIYQILLIIIDSKIHKIEQASQLMDTLCKREYEKYSSFFEKERENSQIWVSYNIIDGIRNALQFSERNEDIFEVNEHLLKKSPNKKTRYDQLFEHTQYLKADLNEKNNLISKIGYQKEMVRNPKDVSVQSNKSIENELQNSDHLQGSHEKSGSRMHSVSKDPDFEQIDKQNEDLSSSYKMTKYQRQSEREDYLQQKNVHERLFKKFECKIQRTSAQHYIKEQEEQEKLKECTFKPKINKNSNKIIERSLSNLRLSNNQNTFLQQQQQQEQPIQDTIKGVKENLKRMEQARQEKEYKDKYWENQRLKYQNSRSRSPAIQSKNEEIISQQLSRSNSPNRKQKLVTEQVKKEKPMLYVDINITKGKSGKISIYQGDNPKDLATNFAKIYNLSSSARLKLVKKLEDILDAYYSQLYDKF